MMGLTLEQRQDRAFPSVGEWSSITSEEKREEQSQSGIFWIRQDCHVSQDVIQIFTTHQNSSQQLHSTCHIYKFPELQDDFGNCSSDLRFGEHTRHCCFWCSENRD